MLMAKEDQDKPGTQPSGGEGIKSLRLRLNRRMAIESKTDSEIVIFDFDTNARFKLTTAIYDLICRFKTPTSVGDVISQYAVGNHLSGIISQLIEKGVLVEENRFQSPKAIKLAANSQTLFNSPRWRKGTTTNVSVVGIPFDLGNTVAAGARGGPDSIRTCSQQYDYRLDFLSGKPVGWFDLDTEERILEGVTFSDWGDLWFSYGENPEKIFQRIASICEDIVEVGSFPLFLGGDHSVTFPIVECLQRHQPLSVIWFDAHNDLGKLSSDASHDHANVARRILDLPNISKIVQIGLKGYTVYNELDLGGEKVTSITASRLRQQGLAAILKLLPESDRFYISLDIDVLDPIYAPATSTPVPGGLTPTELKSLSSIIGLNREVIGLDLVEVNPEKDNDHMTSRVACQLLLAAMGAIMHRRAAALDGSRL